MERKITPTTKQKQAAAHAVDQIINQKKDKPNMSQVARDVYDTGNPKERGMQIKNSPGFQVAVKEMLDRADLTPEKLIFELSKFLGDDKEDNIRLQAWDRAAKLQQLYPEEIKKSVQVQVEGGSFFERLANQEAESSDSEASKKPSRDSRET